MPTIEAGGKTFETDEEGYLVNLGDWNEEISNEIAKQESIEMSENHWEVVNFLRKYYEGRVSHRENSPEAGCFQNPMAGDQFEAQAIERATIVFASG